MAKETQNRRPDPNLPKGDSSGFGSLTLIQKLAHEFKHGNQFLDGEFGYHLEKDGKWHGFANDLYDESEAMMTGFDAEPINGFQISDKNLGNFPFFRALQASIPEGQTKVIETMKKGPRSPYSGYDDIRRGLEQMPKHETYYGIPKKPNN